MCGVQLFCFIGKLGITDIPSETSYNYSEISWFFIMQLKETLFKDKLSSLYHSNFSAYADKASASKINYQYYWWFQVGVSLFACQQQVLTSKERTVWIVPYSTEPDSRFRESESSVRIQWLGPLSYQDFY